MRLLVTGAPRGGTAYISAVLRSCGLDVGHEHMAPDGCVSGFYVGDFERYPCNHRVPLSRAGFDVAIHVTRDPMCAIPSIAHMLSKSVHVREWYEWLELVSPEESHHVAALRAWVFHHESALDNLPIAPRCRLEDLRRDWLVFASAAGTAAAFPEHVQIPNAYPFVHPLTWGDLLRLDVNYAERAADLALRFGYAA